MRAWRTLMLAGAALGALMASSCDSGGSRPPCPAGKLCYERGNVIDPLTLDPLKATTVNEDHLLGDMFTGLVQYDPMGEPAPGMATSWKTSADGLTWTFHLRDAKWSDGAPLTSDDFVYSLRRLMDPKFASEYAYILYMITNAEAVNGGKLPLTALGVDAPDAHTLRIHLTHPVPYLLRVATHETMYPVPRHVIEKYGDQWTDPRHWVSNGPYIIKSWVLGDRIHAVRNPYFYDAKSVCIDEVNYHPGSDAIAVERAVRRGEIDSANDIQSNRIAYLRRPDQIPAYVHVKTWLGTTFLGFNPNAVPAFKDIRVRQALTMAIDRDFITNKLMRGGQLPAYTFVPPGVASYPGSEPPHWAGWSLERRQTEARRLMALAGYTPQHPLKFEFKMRNTNDPQLIYPAVQADWRAIGAEASLYPEESQIAYSDYSARNFQAADIAWIADYNDPMTFLYLMKSTTGPQNYTDYKNPAYDALLDQADHEVDIVRRGQDLAKAEHMAMEDATIAPIFFYVSKNLVSPKITGWVDNLSDWHRTRYLCFAGHKPPG
ncbi:MAG: peptide transporter substrate-binding protein [Caulobacteraceae bacterium]|nr:peptide transporter substrate-binding protein [Caulobacteraceae bacterium]